MAKRKGILDIVIDIAQEAERNERRRERIIMQEYNQQMREEKRLLKEMEKEQRVQEKQRRIQQNEEAHDVDDRVCCANLVKVNFLHRHLVYVCFRLCNVTEYFQTFFFYKVTDTT